MKKSYLILAIMISCLVLTSCTVRKTGQTTTTGSPAGVSSVVGTVAASATPGASATPVKKCKKHIDCWDKKLSMDCKKYKCERRDWELNPFASKICKYEDKRDGTRCTTSPVKPTASATPAASPKLDGYCEAGVCVTGKKTCKEEYGDTYENCPTDGTRGEEGYGECCKDHEKCCHNDKAAEPICCNIDPTKGDTAECDDLGDLGAVFGKHGNICNYKECKSGNPCKKGGWPYPVITICCKPVGIETCSYQNVRQGVGVGSIPLTQVPVCVPAGGTCKTDGTEYLCHTPAGGGVICCRQDPITKKPIEACMSEKNVYWCSAIKGKCPAGESFCGGEKDARADKPGGIDINICCPAGSHCYHNPNGLYRCISDTDGSVVASSDPVGEIIGPIIGADPIAATTPTPVGSVRT